MKARTTKAAWTWPAYFLGTGDAGSASAAEPRREVRAVRHRRAEQDHQRTRCDRLLRGDDGVEPRLAAAATGSEEHARLKLMKKRLLRATNMLQCRLALQDQVGREGIQKVTYVKTRARPALRPWRERRMRQR